MATGAKKLGKPSLGRVLVTGGCGFLGHHIVDMLLASYSASVFVVDLRCSQHRRDSAGVKYFEADISDASKIQSIFEDVKPDVVIHTAAPAPQASSSVSNAVFKKVNVDGTRVIIDASVDTGVKALVYTSSASVISDNVSDLINADERWPVIRGKEQTEYYTETKAEAEEMVLKANNIEPHGLKTCAIRPAGIIGEGDAMTIHHIVRTYQQGRTNVQVGDNNNLFDFTYVENIAHGHLLATRALLETYDAKTIPLDHERVDGEAFFLTNDSPVYFWDFARAIWKAAGSQQGTSHVWRLPRDVGVALGFCIEVVYGIIRQPPTVNRQRFRYSSMTRYYDIGKAKRRLGYLPLVSLDEGIKRAVKWDLEHQKA